MSPARAVGAAATLLLVLLAGCSADNPAPSGTAADGTGGTTGTGTSGTTSGTGGAKAGDGAHLGVRVDGAVRVGVPLPHLDRCVAPQEWAKGNATASGAAWEVRAVNRGHVLWLESDGPALVELHVGLAGRPTCQTLRHDPWSIDPDPAEKTLEALAGGGSAGVVVTLRHAAGPCTTVAAYNGTVSGQGWVVLPAVVEGAKACA